MRFEMFNRSLQELYLSANRISEVKVCFKLANIICENIEDLLPGFIIIKMV